MNTPMEKFSQFMDPVTGINPFLPPKHRQLTWTMALKALFKLPIYLLYLLGIPALPCLIKMKTRGKKHPKGLIYANSVAPFGPAVIKHLFGLECSPKPLRGSCVLFPEGTESNNRAVLSFSGAPPCDYYIGLRFSPEAVYVSGSKIIWVIHFLASNPTVDVECSKASNKNIPQELASTAGLPLVLATAEIKEEFMKIYRAPGSW